MERYHILKLGLAITFYAAYCIRPSLVHSLGADNKLDNNPSVSNAGLDYFQYFQGVDGKPGVDFPVYSYIPRTAFSCRGIDSGYYADLDTNCQVFHICEDGKKISFLCPNGTIFQQSELICEWWNKVNCTNSPNLYEESAERLQNDVARRKASRKVVSPNGAEAHHGAIMRTEERSSVRASKNGRDYPVRQEKHQQRTKNHRIPDNNDIEQQIEQAESNNRHLANVQNSIAASQRNQFGNKQQKYSNHNYKADGGSDLSSRTNAQASRSKQTKKDIDKDTGNYINNNNNFAQSASRQSKKVDQGQKNNFGFGSKTTQEKSSSLKEYYVQFGSTGSGIDYTTEKYSLAGTKFQSTSQNPQHETKSSTFKQREYSSSTAPPVLEKQNTYQQNLDKDRFGVSASTKFPTFDTSLTSIRTTTVATLLNNSNSLSTSTVATVRRRTTEKPAYGIGLKGRYNSFDGIQPQNQETNVKFSENNYRGSVKYNTDSNNVNSVQQGRGKDSSQSSTPVTTYSPPVRYSTFRNSESNNVNNDENYDLPSFPKHKSELTNVNTPQPISSTIARDQIQVNVVIPSQESIKNQNNVLQTSVPSKNEGSKNLESEEAQVPQESSSFVKNTFNSITDDSFKTSASPYPNHRSTYSDIKDVSYLEPPKMAAISSITPHLVTTQPINNGKPFVGSRVGNTVLPNQSTTQSKYTYLPTSTASSKPTIIFGVLRHSSTTELPPYGPPELFNRDSTSKNIIDLFNTGNTDKTLPPVETSRPTTNALPTDILGVTDLFNTGSTDKTLLPIETSSPTTNSRPTDILGITDLFNTGNTDKTLLPIETSNPTTNSRPTDILGITDLFNTGSTDKTLLPIETSNPTTNSRPTDILGITDLFNTGNTDKTLPSVETSRPTTNIFPTEIFNVGNTDSTLQANILPTSADSSTVPPFKIYVPEQGSLNVGQTETPVNINYEGLEPVNEPPFIKKTVPLLYSGHDSTQRTVDHATIYGTYPSSTQRSFASASNTPYSPTVPTVTQSSLIRDYTPSSTPRTSKSFNHGVPIKFDKNLDKVSIHLTKNVGDPTQTNELPKYGSAVQPPLLRVGAVVHVGDLQPLGGSSTTAAPQSHPNGFFVTKGFNDGTHGFSTNPPKSKTEKPRPFSKNQDIEERFNTANLNEDGQNAVTATFPTYHISSARPFGISETTTPTPTFATQPSPSFNVYNNVDSMIGVLQEIANFNSQQEYNEDSRPGLVIPPSVSPQTLHSLAQYFANELQNNETDNQSMKPETKEKLTNLLTAMTVHGYNHLFNIGSTVTPTAATSTVVPETTTVSAPSRFGNDNVSNVEGESSTNEENATGGDGDLISTTSLPELRQLARNFSLALSSYLNDPDNFKKSLEGLRPTEPPPLDGNDNAESSTSEDELLNFSDADIKPSTPAVSSATWGYILAAQKDTQDDVKNSLNPDLNTADSQSFVPRFNNLHVDEKQGKGFTDLPPNHWTSSPQATKLWQKALSVNPAIVNDQFETTPSGILLTEEETTEPELFNPEVLPDLALPQTEVTYDLRELPPLALNSTQVHGILIDFMNHTKSNGHNRLNRILKKLNTSEEEFLDRMKEIESNPLTKRLILLLISECGANITDDFGLASRNAEESTLKHDSEYLSPSASVPAAASSKVENHALGRLINPRLSEDDEDSRALQLLNSLYSIASKFGKKR